MNAAAPLARNGATTMSDTPGAARSPAKRGAASVQDSMPARNHQANSAVLSASPEIPYEQVVKTMDAMRERGGRPLFPGVLLSAGVQ